MRNYKVKVTANIFLIFLLVFMNYSTVLAVPSSPESNQAVADELFISEYIEGSSYNKAMEIYNGTGAEVDLSNYQVALYSNGAAKASQSVTLSGTLQHGEVFVIAHKSADPAILAQADLQDSSVVNFNGDDVVVLKKGETILDIFGEIGTASDFAKDVTQVRNPSISKPNATYDSVEWTEYASNTFAYLGSHTMDGVDQEDPPVDPDPGAEAYSIAEARGLSDGTTVIVEGIVTVDNTAISNGAQYTTYIQDETGGINVFAYEQGAIPDVQEGDRVKVTGELDSYNGLKEIVPGSVEVLEQGQTLPDAQEITLAELQDSGGAEAYEGELVHLTGFINNIPSSPAGGGYNISLVDADFNGTTLRVMEGSLDPALIETDKWYDITAIVSQYNSYQLIPTEQADIQLADDQPDPPTAAGVYESTVDHVTDGDTIHLESPVLGGTKVRFLNMDTPETYTAHNDDPARDAINQNQKAMGEEAKT